MAQRLETFFRIILPASSPAEPSTQVSGAGVPSLTTSCVRAQRPALRRPPVLSLPLASTANLCKERFSSAVLAFLLEPSLGTWRALRSRLRVAPARWPPLSHTLLRPSASTAGQLLLALALPYQPYVCLPPFCTSGAQVPGFGTLSPSFLSPLEWGLRLLALLSPLARSQRPGTPDSVCSPGP